MGRLPVALLVAVLATAGCTFLGLRQVEPPEVHLSNLALLDAGVFEQRLRVDLRVQNPNDFDLPVDGVRFQLEVDGDVIARGSGNEKVRIPRLGDGIVSVTTTASSMALVRRILDFPRRQDHPYRLSGDLFLAGAGGRSVPFEQQGSLPTGR